MMRTFMIKAADLLFFKDGRQLEAGSEYSADSIFPPLPSTIYGALRSRLIANAKGDFTLDDFNLSQPQCEVIGTKQKAGTLRISQVAIGQQSALKEKSDFFVPLPLDVLVSKQKDDNLENINTHIGKPDPSIAKHQQIRSNFPGALSPIWNTHAGDEFLEHPGGYLKSAAFNDYLKGVLNFINTGDKESDGNHLPSNRFFSSEPRMHVALDSSTHTAETGQLFTVGFQRLAEDMGILVSVEDNDMLDSKEVIRLGGEARSAFLYELTKDYQIKGEEIKSQLQESGTRAFKLVTTTPSVFEKGWLPDIIDSDGFGWLGNSKVKLSAASCGRYTTVGGWDIAKNKPKSTYRAVPPGAVYHFELMEGSWDELFDSVFARSVCRNEFAKQGFGISYIGVS